jgi:LCP family protein required for cell wall assembly
MIVRTPAARTARHARAVSVAEHGKRTALLVTIFALAIVAGVAVGIYWLNVSLGDNVGRVPNVFVPLQAADRPPEQAATTFLIVGTDTRSSAPTTGDGALPFAAATAGRSDVIMLAALAADHKSSSVVSIPRDSWLEIPGHGMNKISTAYAMGGPSLLIATIERATGVHIDHFGVIDFAGFQAMVDAVGGIDVQVSRTTSDSGLTFREGTNHLDGAAALVYVRQRHGLPRGDLDRARREQNVLRALQAKAALSGKLNNSIELYRLLDAASKSISVDDTLSRAGMRELALSTTSLPPSAVKFLNAPLAGFGREGPEEVVYLDPRRSHELWSAFRNDTTDEYVATYPSDRLAEVPA